MPRKVKHFGQWRHRHLNSRPHATYDVLMDANEKISQVDLAELEIIHYPHPRLAEVCTPVVRVDQHVVALIERMFELMFEGNGVGLAAPQVGLTARLFISSPTFDPGNRHVYINPQIIATEGSCDSEEGCLSVPGLTCHIKRAAMVTLRAMDLAGETFEQTADGLAARAIQHENDHLDGWTIVDRMGTVAKMANRRQLKELERKFAEAR